jgi:hypothetical protein
MAGHGGGHGHAVQLSGPTVPTNLRANETIKVAGKQKGLTTELAIG